MPTCLHVVKNAQLECTGIFRIVRGLARHADKYGYTIAVLFLGDGPLAVQAREAGIATKVVPWSGTAADMTGALRVAACLRRRRSEVVHFHHGGTLARLLARMSGAQVIGHLHSLSQPGDGAERQLFRGAHAMVACSRAVAECYPMARAEVVYSGVEVSDVPPAPPSTTGPLRLGVLGRLIPLKNVEAAIAAVARLRAKGIDVELEIVGEGPSEPELRALAITLRVQHCVKFQDWQKDPRRVLATWDVLLMLSREEGLPISALEAMAAARVVIASNVGGLVEIISDGVTAKLVPLDDAEALDACVADLARNRDDLVRMSRAAWEKAYREFSEEHMTQKMCALYDQLLRVNR